MAYTAFASSRFQEDAPVAGHSLPVLGPGLLHHPTHGPMNSAVPSSTLTSSPVPAVSDSTGGRNTAGRRVCTWFRGRIGRLLILALVIVVILGWTFAVAEVFLVVKNYGGPPLVFPTETPRQKGFMLYGGIRKWDMDEKTLSVRFLPHFCSTPKICVGYSGNASFYIDNDALGLDGFDESKSVLNWRVDAQDIDQYLDLDVRESARSGQLNLKGLESDALYPFDWYKIRLLVAATTTGTNDTLPIISAMIFNRVSTQWTYYLSFTYLDDFHGQETKLKIEITMRRTIVTRISAILIVIFNWLTTLAICYMTIVYILGQRQLPDGLDSIALPFAGLFALPSVRSVMPGDPPFGCLVDFVGIVPNLCIIAGCATLLLFSRIKRESHGPIIEQRGYTPRKEI